MTNRLLSGRRTALVTGASSGIGAVFARRLSRDGYDLVLTARREARLAELAAELHRDHGAACEVLAADLADPGGIAGVERRLADDPAVDMLVNNAGFGFNRPFHEIAVEDHLRMIRVHVEAAVRLCRAVLPGMMARKSGTIINVSSVAGFLPGTGSGTYGPTKAFLNAFSEALQAEAAGFGIRIQALCPGFTHTEFHDPARLPGFDKSRIPGWAWMKAEEVVDASLRALGGSRVICIPGLKYRIITGIGRVHFFRRLMYGKARKVKRLGRE